MLPQQPEGGFEPVEEQGFVGWRFHFGPFDGGLTLGKGHLVLAVGEGILERTLSCLNSPPAGKDALLAGELYAKARAMMPLEPGLTFQLLDGRRNAKMLRRIIDASMGQWLSMTQQMAFGPAPAEMEAGRMMEQIRELIPSEDELENVMGVGAGYMLVNDQGLITKSATELPPPD